MVAVWVLGRAEEDAGRAVDWNALIEGGIFEFLYRVVVTDIRPPVFHRQITTITGVNPPGDGRIHFFGIE